MKLIKSVIIFSIFSNLITISLCGQAQRVKTKARTKDSGSGSWDEGYIAEDGLDLIINGTTKNMAKNTFFKPTDVLRPNGIHKEGWVFKLTDPQDYQGYLSKTTTEGHYMIPYRNIEDIEYVHPFFSNIHVKILCKNYKTGERYEILAYLPQKTLFGNYITKIQAQELVRNLKLNRRTILDNLTYNSNRLKESIEAYITAVSVGIKEGKVQLEQAKKKSEELLKTNTSKIEETVRKLAEIKNKTFISANKQLSTKENSHKELKELLSRKQDVIENTRKLVNTLSDDRILAKRREEATKKMEEWSTKFEESQNKLIGALEKSANKNMDKNQELFRAGSFNRINENLDKVRPKI